MEFEELLNRRYATKKFDGRKIDRSALARIEDMIRLTPSAINLQPWKVKVVSDDATKAALSPLAMGQAQITTCSDLLVFCADTDFEDHAERLATSMKAAGVPQANVDHLRAFIGGYVGRFTPEQRLCEAQKNTFLAAITAIYAAKSLGIDSCPMQGFDPAGFARVLKLPGGLVPTIAVPLGYPADQPAPKTRFPKEDIFF